jgi:hypothetical protein
MAIFPPCALPNICGLSPNKYKPCVICVNKTPNAAIARKPFKPEKYIGFKLKTIYLQNRKNKSFRKYQY